MKKIIFISLTLIPFYLFGQKSQLISVESGVDAGQIMLSHSALKENRYTFDDRISRFYIDSVGQHITLQLRGVTKDGKWLNNKGYLCQFDIPTQQLLWSNKMNYQTTMLLQNKDWMVMTENFKSINLDPLTGKELWTIKKDIYYINAKTGIALGYDFMNGFSSKPYLLRAFDRQSGQELWKRKIDREYTWNGTLHLNDSTMIIISSGLHEVNLYTGKGWDYNAITGLNNYTRMALTNVAGIGLGLLTGAFIVSTGHDIVTNIDSNVWSDSTKLYFASKEELVCLDYAGNKLWQTALPKNKMAKSLLFVRDSTILLVNEGFGNMGYRHVTVGQPFIAGYSCNNGAQKFFAFIDIPKAIIEDCKQEKDTMYLLTKQYLISYSLKDGSEIKKSAMLMKDKEEFYSFMDKRQIYFPIKDSTYQSFSQSDSTSLGIYTTKGKMLSVNRQFSIDKQLDSASVYVAYQKRNGITFIANGKHTLVINDKGAVLAKIKASDKARLSGDILYDTDNNTLITIDLKALIERYNQ